ncbi:hypothetical protein Pmani_011862 [Petrolisthes manimaculis]|uniref:Chitin-binding type-2 domain-containing protein n=1 Tax=Petrolisthes manimaculis TaxID=1843537 RepID=A0AAE1Q094_9EUCA|nr:hypothetical protein Pmani_011862 [Petrolisthes manimaculis]
MKANVVLGVLFVCASFQLSRSEKCPGNPPHKCTILGYEVWNEETGEVVQCMGMGAVPQCLDPPMNVAGNPITTVANSPVIRNSESACAPATCVNKEANVLYPHPECNCQKYYVCRNPVLGGSDLILYQYTCFGNEVFNPNTGTCTSPGTYICPTTTPPATTIITDSTPKPTTTTTTTPTTTTTTPTTTTTTPTTTTTTPTTTTTTPTTTTTTPTTTTTTPTPTTTTTTTPCNPSPATCVNKEANVLYPHPECNCQKYYVCRNPVLGGSDLILYQYTCFGNEVFNPNTGTCTSPGTYICP